VPQDLTPEEQEEADRIADEQRREARGDHVDDAPLTAEELAAVAREDEDGAPEKPPKWVADRLREASERAREERDARIRAEAERDALRAAPPKEKPVPVDVDDLYAKAKAALLEGDSDTALKLEKQARAEERRQAVEEAEQRAVARLTQAQAERDLRKAANAVAKEYPFLDSNSPEADSKAIKEVVEWRDFYISRGDAPDDALTKAAEKVAGTRKAPGGGDEADDELARRRAAQALSRSGAAALRQPPPASGGKGDRARAGMTADVDVAKMSDKEFRDLPAAEKARLRGDSV
jgi:hypothetical protein